MFIMALFFGAMIAASAWIAFIRPRPPDQAFVCYFIFAVGSVFFGVGAVLFLYFAGPGDLRIDMQKRAYRFRSGFPLAARTTTGSLDDIDQIFVKFRANGNGFGRYYILLRWKTPRKLDKLLGTPDFAMDSNRDEDKANAELDLILQTLSGRETALPSESPHIGLNAGASNWHKRNAE